VAVFEPIALSKDLCGLIAVRLNSATAPMS
jgi:hypothetical protein